MANYVEAQCVDCGMLIFMEEGGEPITPQCATCERQCKESAEFEKQKAGFLEPGVYHKIVDFTRFYDDGKFITLEEMRKRVANMDDQP